MTCNSCSWRPWISLDADFCVKHRRSAARCPQTFVLDRNPPFTLSWKLPGRTDHSVTSAADDRPPRLRQFDGRRRRRRRHRKTDGPHRIKPDQRAMAFDQTSSRWRLKVCSHRRNSDQLDVCSKRRRRRFSIHRSRKWVNRSWVDGCWPVTRRFVNATCEKHCKCFQRSTHHLNSAQ